MKEEQVMHFKEKEELYAEMKNLFRNGDIILAKASRTMEFEQIVEKILNEQE